jgi:hypothetical protein
VTIFFLQERIGEYLSSSRDTKAVGRRPFDKMATLLAYLGPPEHRAVDTQFLVKLPECSLQKNTEILNIYTT